MKKILMLATAAFLVSGVAFAQTEKKCAKGKECCKKDCKKDAKTAKTTAKPAAKAPAKKA